MDKTAEVLPVLGPDDAMYQAVLRYIKAAPPGQCWKIQVFMPKTFGIHIDLHPHTARAYSPRYLRLWMKP